METMNWTLLLIISTLVGVILWSIVTSLLARKKNKALSTVAIEATKLTGSILIEFKKLQKDLIDIVDAFKNAFEKNQQCWSNCKRWRPKKK